MHEQFRRVRVGDERRRRGELAVGGARDHRQLVRADRIGVFGDLGKPLRLHHLRVAQRLLRGDDVVGLFLRLAEQLDQFDVRQAAELAAQILEVADLERLDEQRRAFRGVGVLADRGEHRIFHRQADAAEIG